MFWVIDSKGTKFVFDTIDAMFDFIAVCGDNIVEGWVGL